MRCGRGLREQCATLLESTWGPILLHGTYDCLLFVAAGEGCDEKHGGLWPWLYLPVCLGIAAMALYVRWRVLSVERRFPPRDDFGGEENNDDDLHAKIRSGEIRKPCVCGRCCGCVCCVCCECCY